MPSDSMTRATGELTDDEVVLRTAIKHADHAMWLTGEAIHVEALRRVLARLSALEGEVERRGATLRAARAALEDYLWGDVDVSALAEAYGDVCEALGLLPRVKSMRGASSGGTAT